jgi:hypothetical protein
VIALKRLEVAPAGTGVVVTDQEVPFQASERGFVTPVEST